MVFVKKNTPDSSVKKLAHNVSSLLVVQVSNYILPLISLPYFTRIVGPEKFGTINFIGAFVAYFILITNFGFDTTATRDVVMTKDNPRLLNQLCSEVFYSKSLLLVVSIFFYAALLLFIPQLRSELFVSVASFLICFAYVITPNWLFQGFQDNHILALYNLASKVLFTIAILTLVKTKEDYILYPLLLSLSQILIGLIAFFRIRYNYSVRLIKVTFQNVITRLKSGKEIFISLFVINLYTTTNIIIIGFFDTEESVGLLSAALKIMALLQACISVPFSQALFPFISQKFKISKEEGLRIVQLIFPVILAIGFVCCIGCNLFSPLIIRWIFGTEFSGAVNMLRILSFIPLVVVYSQFLGIQIMINLNMDRVFRKVILYGAVGGLILNLVGGYVGGAKGISITYLTAELIIAGLFTYFLKKENISFSLLFSKMNKDYLTLLLNYTKKNLRGKVLRSS